MVTDASRRRRVLALTLPLVVVAAQEIFIGTGHREPYPGLRMPEFRGTRTAADGSITIDAVLLSARFDDGQTVDVPLAALLSPMPHFTKMPAARVGLRDLGHASSQMAPWLRTRLAALHPGRHATSFEARWYQDTYRVQDGELRRVAHSPVRSSQIELTR
jgi:hypothetical protein